MTTEKALTPLARLLRHLSPSAKSVYEAFKYSPGQSRDEEGKFSTGLSGRATFIPYPGRRSLVKNPATLGDIQSVLKPPPNLNYVTGMDSHQRRELIIASDNIAHAEIANAAYPDDPDGSTRFLDNSTHFTLQFDSDQTPKEVGFNVRYAGVIMGRNPSREEETAAMDNIYNTMSHLTNMGISEKTPVVIKMANNKPLETTLEKALALRVMLGWKYSPGQPRDAAGRFGSSLGGGGGVSPGGDSSYVSPHPNLHAAVGRAAKARDAVRAEQDVQFVALGKQVQAYKESGDTAAAQASYKKLQKFDSQREKANDTGRKVLYDDLRRGMDEEVTVHPYVSRGLENRAKAIEKANAELPLGNKAVQGPVNVLESFDGGRERSQYNNGTIRLRNGPRAKEEYIHELGHHLEERDPAVHAKAVAFLERRTRGETPRPLGGDYDRNEITRPDKFIDPYVGKVYQSRGRINATEVISMGLERMYKDPIGFAKADPEHFDLTAEAMGYKGG